MNNMKKSQFLALISKKAGSIVLIGLFVATFSFLALIVKEKNFKVSSDYLIIQNQSGSQDFYTLSKSAEYIGRVLNEGIYSELFINEVVKTGKVNSEFLPFDKKEKLKQWSEMVQVSRNPELGIMTVEIFDNNQKESIAVSQAVADVLTNKNSLFRGADQNIDVKILSGPVVEKNPSVSNIIVSSIGGFILGIMLGGLWFIFKEDRRKKDIFSNSFLPRSSNTQARNSIRSRMEMAGNFMSDEEYQESLKYIDE